jgi:mannitol/fructose-specific phosphotransferase system IIA component (Ntr-type)
MLITEFIAQNRIEPNLEAGNKADALRALTQLLFRGSRLKGGAAAADQIMAREAIESTGIGRGIAVPHARTPSLKHLRCAVGRIPEGLDFNAVDKKPVYLIFLICYPPAQQTTYLNFVASVAKLLREGASLQAILDAGSAAEIFEVLERLSETLVKPEEQLSREKLAEEAESESATGVTSDLILLARLDLCREMLESAGSGKKEIEQRIENISTLLDPEILEHYQRLKKTRHPPLVAVEGGVCQGCLRQLPTELEQRVYRSRGRLYRCRNCNRFIYAV